MLRIISQSTSEVEVFFTREVDTIGRRHRDSGPVDRPDPRLACPSASLGGSDRTRPYQVWGYTLGTAALSKKSLKINSLKGIGVPEPLMF